jgi:hypothetical protein
VKIPDVLPRYVGDVPEFSLALLAYTVSTYSAVSGIRKDQINANLHIHFGVLLNEPAVWSADEVSNASGDEKDAANK